MKPELKKIKRELLDMAKRDQDMRTKWFVGNFSKENYDSKIDKKNQEKLKKIVDVYGWPKISEFGEEASDAAWLIVQHSPDIEFKEKMLEKMKNLGKEEVRKRRIAQTIDRIQINKGKPQIYGTNFNINLEKDTIEAPIVKDPKNLNKRRAEMDWDSSEEHLKRAVKSYEEHKKNNRLKK